VVQLVYLFVALKLAGAISWPWVWVLAPLWVGLVAVILCIAAGITIATIAALRAARSGRRGMTPR
jgi:hypothetical protein